MAELVRFTIDDGSEVTFESAESDNDPLGHWHGFSRLPYGTAR
jgi:hypothetical protein